MKYWKGLGLIILSWVLTVNANKNATDVYSNSSNNAGTTKGIKSRCKVLPPSTDIKKELMKPKNVKSILLHNKLRFCIPTDHYLSDKKITELQQIILDTLYVGDLVKAGPNMTLTFQDLKLSVISLLTPLSQIDTPSLTKTKINWVYYIKGGKHNIPILLTYLQRQLKNFNTIPAVALTIANQEVEKEDMKKIVVLLDLLENENVFTKKFKMNTQEAKEFFQLI